MELLRSIPELEAVRGDWNALADSQGHALLRHDWIVSAAKTLHDPKRLSVVIRRTGGRLDAAAPLVRRTMRGVERLEFVGAEALHEPTGLLARDAAARSTLVADLFRLRRPLMLQRVTGAGEIEDVERAARRRGVLIVKRTAPSLAVPLHGAAVELSAKLRYDIKRARTRASGHGAVSMDVVTPRREDVDEQLDMFIRVEASGWKARNGSAMSVNRRMQSFFRTYARMAAQAGTLRMFFLRVGDRVAAAQIAVEVYERLWVLKIGYDEALSRCSPGFLLTAEAIGYAARQGLRSYEFLGAAEAWEQRWRSETRACALVAFYPYSVRGGVSASVDAAGAAWRRLRSARSVAAVEPPGEVAR
jgi:CelD/BcsL family acetyltransferase involved in cellulose biosynthesis